MYPPDGIGVTCSFLSQMSVNYTQDSVHQHNGSTKHSYEMGCMTTSPGSIVYTLFFIINTILLLPSCILIFHQDLLQWWRRSTSSSATAVQKPLDVFNTYYALIELLTILAHVICCCGIYTNDVVLQVGYYMWCFVWFGEVSFHVLTCLDRYLAVVHPVVFRRLRGKRGVRIRNILLSCVWLFCIGGTALVPIEDVFPHICLSFVLFIFAVLTIFSLSVLCTLIHPVPGQHSGAKRAKVDQSKQMAFYTILAILGSEFLKIISNALWSIFSPTTHPGKCLVIMTGLWFCIPSGQVLPFLILQKAGTITCSKQSTK